MIFCVTVNITKEFTLMLSMQVCQFSVDNACAFLMLCNAVIVESVPTVCVSYVVHFLLPFEKYRQEYLPRGLGVVKSSDFSGDIESKVALTNAVKCLVQHDQRPHSTRKLVSVWAISCSLKHAAAE